MHIAIYASGLPFNGETIPKGESLGGSETAAYYMAKELAAMGHQVVCFTNSTQTGKWDGVVYEYHGKPTQHYPLGERFHFTMQVPYDVVIIQRHPLGFIRPINSKLNIWWLHDLALYRNSLKVQNHLYNTDRTLTVSEFHKKQVCEVYGIDKDHVLATWNGCDYDMFKGLDKIERQPNVLTFAARPERGLNELVGHESIMEQLPDCHLYVCSYKNTPEHMKGFYDYMWARCQHLPNVTNVGHLGKRELYELLARSALYVYPTTFEDTSCIMVLEANAAGTPFVSFEQAALPETCQGAGAVLLPLNKGQVNKKAFVKTVNELLKNKKQWNALHEKALSKYQTWQSAAIQWDSMFKIMLAEKSSNQVRLYKHLEHMSDVYCIKDEAKDDLKDNYHFMYSEKYKEHYDKYYEYEKDRGVVYGKEDLTNNPRFEQTVQLIAELKPKSVLDYGCAHGHYVINLAERIPDIKRIVGVDINNSNIETANDWLAESPVKDRDISFMVGDHNTISQTDEKFDLILVCELLEHVPRPREIVESLIQRLSSTGHMLISTPYGGWEALGYDLHPGWRAHIHHFERSDLFEMFGKQDNYRLIALPHSPDMGHFICTFKPSGEPIGEIDYERKLIQQAPRETVSVCMIARDAEYTIGKTLQTVKPIADEIIVGIDEKTTDKTRSVCKAFGAKTYKMKSPLEVGFDTCRNESIGKAKMDWIFWIDSDETFEQAENLNKYLRNNCYHGYAIKQHHYAVQPAELFKTDLPVRLFRNRLGIKFYGHVHEHPELKYNKGMGKIAVLPDVAIMHTGYSTEAIRRDRFKRNFPLIKIDRKKHPNRKLGRFLWLRDLAHLCKYTIEAVGEPTPEVMQYAETVVSLFEELLKDKNTRLIAAALPFYSEAVMLLGGGIAFEFDMKAWTGNGDNNSTLPQKVGALYKDDKTIRKVVSHMMSDIIKPYTEKYF